jgi:hypothetical protein
VTRASWLRLLLVLVAVAAAAVAAAELASQGGPAPASPARGGHAVESIFEDDQLLVYPPLTVAGNAEVQRTLQTIRALGADRIRVVVVWHDVAPDDASTTPPPGFDGADPTAYPEAGWLPYDRVVRLAQLDGLRVLLTVTAPGPLWASAPGAPDPKTATHYRPDPRAYEQFVEAVGRRFSGSFTPGGEPGGALPRVSEWSIWNEPNQPGWLAPQSSATAPVAPRLYRGLLDAGYAGLLRSGHGPGRDTVLIGELAPEGSPSLGPAAPLTPMPFLRAMYCVDGAYQPLRGAAAVALGCPASGAPSSFVRAHPGLFDATGFAHHPYSLLTAPAVSLADPDDVPLADLGRLENGLDRIFAAYGVIRRLPLYLTEYGYLTNPPNACKGVPLTAQAAYLDQAQYMAWLDPRVRALGQFDLQDQAHPPGSCRDWITFQSGLEFLGGARKPSFAAYRLPIFLPRTTVAGGARVLVWGMLRPAPNGTPQTATVQWRPRGGAYRTLGQVTTENPSGFLETRVPVPASGEIRLSWRGLESRAVAVSVSG